MKNRDIVISLVLLVVLITGVILIFRTKNKSKSDLPIPTPNIVERVNKAFPNIPDGVERANLRDMTGGNSLGVATRTEVIANLPPSNNYQVELENSSGKIVNLGYMRFTKSGYLLQYNLSDYPGYNKVIVKDGGSINILEGSF